MVLSLSDVAEVVRFTTVCASQHAEWSLSTTPGSRRLRAAAQAAYTLPRTLTRVRPGLSNERQMTHKSSRYPGRGSNGQRQKSSIFWPAQTSPHNRSSILQWPSPTRPSSPSLCLPSPSPSSPSPRVRCCQGVCHGVGSAQSGMWTDCSRGATSQPSKLSTVHLVRDRMLLCAPPGWSRAAVPLALRACLCTWSACVGW